MIIKVLSQLYNKVKTFFFQNIYSSKIFKNLNIINILVFFSARFKINQDDIS